MLQDTDVISKMPDNTRTVLQIRPKRKRRAEWPNV
jgi:hypothetical protein